MATQVIHKSNPQELISRLIGLKKTSSCRVCQTKIDIALAGFENGFISEKELRQTVSEIEKIASKSKKQLLQELFEDGKISKQALEKKPKNNGSFSKYPPDPENIEKSHKFYAAYSSPYAVRRFYGSSRKGATD